MGMFSWLCLVGLVTIVPGKALLDLNGTWEVEGTWRASVTLPCVYEPLPGFKEISVVWKTAQQDRGLRTLFHRDATSGDQTLLASFRGRLTVPKEPPGVVSLQIKALEMADVGQYACEVVWVARDKQRITKERTMTLRVFKVPVTKPIIQLSSNRTVLSPGMDLTLTCLARGSPPITYQWFKIVPVDAGVQIGEEAALRFERLEPFHAGRYYCKAKNQIDGPRVEQSDTVQVPVEETVATTAVEPSERPAPQKASLPLYLVIVIALLCAVVVSTVFAVIFCKRRSKEDHNYQVAFHNNSMNAREGGNPEHSGGVTEPHECPYEEPCQRAQNNYTEEPARGGGYMPLDEPGQSGDSNYESLVSKVESDYEPLEYK